MWNVKCENSELDVENKEREENGTTIAILYTQAIRVEIEFLLFCRIVIKTVDLSKSFYSKIQFYTEGHFILISLFVSVICGMFFLSLFTQHRRLF